MSALLLVLTPLVFVLTACSSPASRSSAAATRSLADVSTLLLTDSSAGPGHESNGISSALRHPDGRILLANAGNPELTLFDPAGAFLGAVGRKGQWPGEWSGTAPTV